MDATNKGVGGWEGMGRVEGGGEGLTLPSDTGSQVVCTVRQADDHSSPDHTTRRADVKWNSLTLQATLLMHPSGPTGSMLVLCGLIGSAKSHQAAAGRCVKAGLLLCHCVWVVLECGYYNKQ